MIGKDSRLSQHSHSRKGSLLWPTGLQCFIATVPSCRSADLAAAVAFCRGWNEGANRLGSIPPSPLASPVRTPSGIRGARSRLESGRGPAALSAGLSDSCNNSQAPSNPVPGGNAHPTLASTLTASSGQGHDVDLAYPNTLSGPSLA